MGFTRYSPRHYYSLLHYISSTHLLRITVRSSIPFSPVPYLAFCNLIPLPPAAIHRFSALPAFSACLRTRDVFMPLHFRCRTLPLLLHRISAVYFHLPPLLSSCLPCTLLDTCLHGFFYVHMRGHFLLLQFDFAWTAAILPARRACTACTVPRADYLYRCATFRRHRWDFLLLPFVTCTLDRTVRPAERSALLHCCRCSFYAAAHLCCAAAAFYRAARFCLKCMRTQGSCVSFFYSPQHHLLPFSCLFLLDGRYLPPFVSVSFLLYTTTSSWAPAVLR